MSASRPRTFRHLLHFSAILAIFVVAGPPIGAMIFFLAIGAVGMGTKTDLAGLAWMGLFALIYAAPLSYLFGAVPAAIAGGIVATARTTSGLSSAAFAFVVGGCVGIGFQVFNSRPLISPSEQWRVPLETALIISVCALSAVACHLIVNALLGPAQCDTES